MTPQEKDLIQNVARKLQSSPDKPKDADAEQLIASEIASQQDAVYKLTQAVLVQEMALKELKQKNDYLEQNAEYYRNESQRGAMSKMFGGSRPAPVPPQPVNQPSAFGSFMQTAAGVAAGMVAGHLISDMLFGDEAQVETAAADDAADAATDSAADAAADTSADTAPVDTAAADTGADTAPVDTAAADTGADSSFLGGDSGFASEYTDSGFGSGTGFGADDTGFGSDTGFGGDDMFANNDDTNSGFFGGGDDFGGEDFGGDDDF